MLFLNLHQKKVQKKHLLGDNTQPPTCKTGVNRTMTTLIDYLAVTGGDSLRDFVLSLLGPGRASRTLFGYDQAYTFDVAGVTLLESSRADMGIHLRLSGEGCAALREHLVTLLTLGRASRLDLAVDGLPVSVPAVFDLARAGLVRRLSSSYRWIESNKGESPHTLYLGSRSSDKMLRVYSKAGITRFEFECKGRLAAGVQHMIIKGTSLASIIAGLGSFLQKKGSNTAQDVLQSFWCRLDEAVAVVLPKVTRSIERTIRWLKTSVAESLVRACEADPTLLHQLYKIGHKKVWKSQFMLFGAKT